MAVPIVCFVGKSNSGKTTFIERVIPELVRAGYKIATVKQAGASSVVILSKGSMAMFADASDQLKVEDIRDRFLDGSYDLIIAEGWKHEGYPKIVIIREQVGEIPISSEGLLAVVSDKPLDVHVPRFDLDDVPAVAALIMKHFPLRRVRGEHELDV
jgi:molybdopterin-guanine dinucleotide biosynthesis protein B